MTTPDHPEGLEGSGQSNQSNQPDQSRRIDPTADRGAPDELVAIDVTGLELDEPAIELYQAASALAIEEAEWLQPAEKAPAAFENAEEGAAPVANTAPGAKVTPPVANTAPGAKVTPPLASLLPMAPGVAVDEPLTYTLPVFPRYGPPLPADPPAPMAPPSAYAKLERKRGVAPRWAPFAVLVTLVALPAILIAYVLPAINAQLVHRLQPDQLPALTNRLASATAVTQLDTANAAFGGQTYPVAPAFATYYAAHDGQDTLGAAITPPFTSNLGETQFFTGGALVSADHKTREAIANDANDANGDLDPDLARNGVDDSQSGVIALPLGQELLALGSAAPIGGDDSGATYATLRAAARPTAFVTAPKPTASDTVIRGEGAPDVILSSGGAFVVEGKRGGQSVGHSIPLALWTYINRGDVAPQGWATDVGAPLTEPLKITATRDGARHHLLVQAFPQMTLIADLDQPDATGAPTVTMQPTGRDYLRTAGGPTIHPSPQPQRWLTQNGALRASAGASAVAVGLNSNSAVTLSGEGRWLGSDLWYAVTWKTPSRSGSAWVDADALTDTAPTAPAVNGFDVLSPDLAKYLAARGKNIGVVAYDITRGVMYSYNSGGLFIMASSAKVPLMVSYLEHIESLGRKPNSYDMSLLTAMIEHSDNNAAQVIYDTLGYDGGQRSHMRAWGITDYVANSAGWGWAKWSPGDMARLLTLLQTGKVLNASDRATVFYLMSHIERDQQFGVGDSAPAGANFWMKNGWVTGPDGAWNVNSSGIVKVGSETYIVTVYNGELGSYTQGVNIVDHVCGAIGQALK